MWVLVLIMFRHKNARQQGLLVKGNTVGQARAGCTARFRVQGLGFFLFQVSSCV